MGDIDQQKYRICAAITATIFYNVEINSYHLLYTDSATDVTKNVEVKIKKTLNRDQNNYLTQVLKHTDLHYGRVGIHG